MIPKVQCLKLKIKFMPIIIYLQRFYEKLQSYKSKREELEEDLDNHSFGSSSHKDNNTSTPKLHRATVGGKNGGGGSGKFSLKDKVSINKDRILFRLLLRMIFSF